MSVKPILDPDETFITDGSKLNGKAMPDIIKLFRERLVGRTVVDVGYLTRGDEEEGVWPCLVMDNGHLLMAMMDDEGNGPGVMCFQDSRLCQTSLKPDEPVKRLKK